MKNQLAIGLTALGSLGFVACSGEITPFEEGSVSRASSALVGGTPVSGDTVGAVNVVLLPFGTNSGSTNVGSAGLINGEWVMTARHVVEYAFAACTTPEEREKCPVELQLGDYPAAPTQRRSLKWKNVYFAPGPRDVALIRVDAPFTTTISRTFAPVDANPITCYGYGPDTSTGAGQGVARSWSFANTKPKNVPSSDTCMFVAPYDSSNASRFGGGGGDSGSLCFSDSSPNAVYGIVAQTYPLYSQDEFEKVTCFGDWATKLIAAKRVAQLDFDGDGVLDYVRFYVSGGTIWFRAYSSKNGSENAAVDTTIPLAATDPLPAVVGNFIPNLNSTLDCEDVGIVAAGKFWPFVGNCSNSIESRGSLTMWGLKLADVDAALRNATSAAIEAVASTGEVVSFSGFTGSSGVATASYAMGFPSATTRDGLMLSLSGVGFETVASNLNRLKVSQATTQELSGNRLKVEVFDGDFGQKNDSGDNNAATCFQLVTDPCGDLGVNNCSLGTNGGKLVTGAAKEGSSMVDDGWSTLYDGQNDPDASTNGTSSGPFSYMVRSFLAEPGHDCASMTNIPSIVNVAGVNVFKVRANARVSRPVGESSVWGVARTGQWGASGIAAFPSTNYNGVIDLRIAGSLSGNEMLLEEYDADDLDDPTKGVATGANTDIRFWVTKPNGEKATVTGGDYPSGTLIVENPSGNYDANPASPDKDIEKYSVNITGTSGGVWTWHWEGVGAHNNIMVKGPFGSPAAYEIVGAETPRALLSSAQPLAYWAGPGASSIQLPVVLGSTNSAGAAEGESLVVRTPTQAQALLNGAPTDLRGRLARQLLGAKLNIARAHAANEQLENAVLYATTEGVDAVLREADAVLRGPTALVDVVRAERLIVLLNALNQADVTYLQPGVPSPSASSADDDGDGFPNLIDNCPTVSNISQADSDGDLVGDACAVIPRVDCVLPIRAGTVRVYFGYNSELSYRRIPLGRRNNVSVATARPISEFAAGSHSKSFSLDVTTASAASWTVDGTTVTGASTTPVCGGTELLTEQPLPNLALFGDQSVTIADGAVVEGNALSGGSLELGAHAEIQEARSKGSMFLRSSSTVHKSAVAGLTVTPQDGVSVEGETISNAYVAVKPLSWNVAFSGTPTQLEVPSGATMNLPSTGLQMVTVRNSGTLRIAAGTYALEALQVETGGRLLIDDAAGPVVLQVRSSLFIRGPVTRTGIGKPASSFLIGYFGTNAAFIEVAYRGSLVAPNAGVVLGNGAPGRFEGQWFGKSIEIRPNLRVVFAD